MSGIFLLMAAAFRLASLHAIRTNSRTIILRISEFGFGTFLAPGVTVLAYEYYRDTGGPILMMMIPLALFAIGFSLASYYHAFFSTREDIVVFVRGRNSAT